MTGNIISSKRKWRSYPQPSHYKFAMNKKKKKKGGEGVAGWCGQPVMVKIRIVNTHTHTHTPTCIHTQSHTHVHCAHTGTCAQCAHICKLTHTHTHTHTHTLHKPHTYSLFVSSVMQDQGFLTGSLLQYKSVTKLTKQDANHTPP